MLTVIKTDSGNVTAVNLIGTIDENTDLDAVIGSVGRELHVGCKRVSRINSHGVRNWIMFFSQLKESGTKVTFSECSPFVVDLMNLVCNFKCDAEIDSISVPYSCQSCRQELVAVIKTKDLETLGSLESGLTHRKCPHCNGMAMFDDDANYFKRVTLPELKA